MIKSIFLTGVGGQGVVTMANMISAHLQKKGTKATLIHSTGMAQRGGRVTSEIRFTDDQKTSFGPRVSSGSADYMIGMDMSETINSIDFMKKNGTLIFNEYTLVSTQSVIKKERVPDGKEVKDLFNDLCGRIAPISVKDGPANMFILGVFTAECAKDKDLKGFFSPEEFRDTLKTTLKKRTEENLAAFSKGVEFRAEV